MLIIDEGSSHRNHIVPVSLLNAVPVSMIDGDLFEKISKVGTIIRKHNDPFGGIQASQLFYRDREWC